MNREDRLIAILDLLGESGSLGVGDLVDTFGVSPATARRDLDVLADRQLLNRTHGGASAQSVAYDLPLRYKRGQATEAKSAIAIAASELVRPGARIGLTGGTTCTAIATELSRRSDLEQERPTVVTNAINIAAQLVLRPHIKVVMVGGAVNPRSYELAGPLAEPILRQIKLDVAFIGINALDVHDGPFVHDEKEARVNSLMAGRADQAWIVADSSKLGNQAFAAVGPLSDFRGLITDDGIADAERDALIDQGLDVRIVHP